jgi:hypothetical protein
MTTFLWSNYDPLVLAEGTKGSSINMHVKLPTDSFLISGPLSGLVYSDSSFNANVIPPDILLGYWNMSVQKGIVKYFIANFTITSINGSPRYHILITNFQALGNSAKQLDVNGSITDIDGYSDIKIDNNYQKTKVAIGIIIYRLGTIAILLPSLSIEDRSDDILRGKPIYGLVHSFVDEKGKKYITGLS